MRTFICGLLALAMLGTAAAAGASASGGNSAAPVANSGGRGPHRQRVFDEIDTNHDGVVSRAEYQAWVDGRFDKFDTNHDGRIDANEIAASPETARRVHQRAERFVRRHDPNGNGQVSRADFEAGAMQRFDRLGGGADTLTADQFAAHRGRFMHGRTPPASPHGG